MLDKKDRPLPGPGTVIGSNVKLVGALRDVNDITIHGTVDGEVHSEKAITIGETAAVKGPVTGVTITIAGTVRGAIEADNRLELMPSAKIYGNITTKDLIIRSGAIFVGKCVMGADDAKDQREPSEPVREVTKPANKAEYEVE